MGSFLIGHDVLRDYLHHFVSGNRYMFSYCRCSPKTSGNAKGVANLVIIIDIMIRWKGQLFLFLSV